MTAAPEGVAPGPPSVASALPRRLVGLALWLGVVGFGGGFAVAQRIRTTLVHERRWMTESSFMEQFTVAGALPGTTATNLLAMIGFKAGGVRLAVASAAAFLAPSVALMLALGAAYDTVRSVAAIGAFLDGMSWATVGIVAAVAFDMRRAAVRTWLDWILSGCAAALLALRALNLLEVVALAGVIGALTFRPPSPRPPAPDDEMFAPASSRLASVMILPPALAAASGVFALFFVFARIGVATFGGGFAMIPPIEHEVVSVRGWLSESAFGDAMVLGQVTPGPVAIAATFIGYRVGGLAGAAAATLGMFGPPLVLSILASRSLTAFRSNVFVRGFLSGVSPAVVGVIAAAAIALFRTSVHSWFAGAIAASSFAVLAKWPRLLPLAPLAAGGILNVALH